MPAVDVFLRVRPGGSGDGGGCLAPAPGIPGAVVLAAAPAEPFAFDGVFAGGATQGDVYARAVRPLVAAAQGGQRAALLAYGQTGSGKTFTCIGGTDGAGRVVNDGLVLQAAAELLGACGGRPGAAAADGAPPLASTLTTPTTTTTQVTLQVLEIYNVSRLCDEDGARAWE